MLSTASEYALRSMCCLARHDQEAMTADAVARETHIESEYLAKVLGLLARGGLIRSRQDPRPRQRCTPAVAGAAL